MQRLKFFKIQLVKGLLYWSENLSCLSWLKQGRTLSIARLMQYADKFASGTRHL